MFRWTVHLNPVPNRVYLHAAVAVGNKLYSFGGGNIEDKDGHMDSKMGVFVFNTMSLLWRKLTPVTPEVPSVRQYHMAVLIEDSVYIWGGMTYSNTPHHLRFHIYCNELYTFDVNTHIWFKPRVYGTIPEGRSGTSACVLGKDMYIHGGKTSKMTRRTINGRTEWTIRTNDIYKLDTTMMVWTLVNTRGTPPLASSRHSATIFGKRMFVFGGWSTVWVGGRQHYKTEYYNTIRVFDTETNCWLNTPASAQLPPEECRGHSVFIYNGELYIFGGSNLNVLWKFNPEIFYWKKVELKGTPPCLNYESYQRCCCVVRDRIIFFGGVGKNNGLCVLYFNPSLKTLCKLAVIQYSLDKSEELPHNIMWELAAISN